MELKIKPVPEEDLERCHALREEYGSGFETWEDTVEHFKKWPSLSIAAYLNGELIGVAVGKPSAAYPKGELLGEGVDGLLEHLQNDYVELNSIMVESKHWRKGFGSKLLRYFEKQVNKMEKKIVTVGAAENVDGYYLANGYKPVSYCVSVEPKKLPDNYRALGYEIVRERKEGNEWVFNVPTKEYKPGKREEIKNAFNARQVIYIYEKEV